MSVLTDLVLRFGQTVGWDFALLALASYQLFCPRSWHPKGGTKFQRLLMEPNPAVIVAIEALAEENSGVDDVEIKELFNGGVKTHDLKTPDDLRNGK